MINHKKIFSLSAGVLGGRIFGYLREICLVVFFGANSSSDIILIIFLMPDLINSLVSTSSITSIFLTELRSKSEINVVANVFKSYLDEIALISYVLLVSFSFLYYDFFVATYISIALISIFYNFRFGIEISKSQYYNDFKFTSLSNIIYNTGTIIAVFLAKINIYFSSLIIVVFSLLRFYLARNRFNNLYSKSKISNVKYKVDIVSRKDFLIALTSTSVLLLAPMFDKIIAFEIGDGVLTLYNYAEKIFILPLSLVLVPVFSANYPILTRLWNSNNKNEYNILIKKVLIVTTITSISIFLSFILMGEYAINLIFDLTKINTTNTQLILKYFNILILGLFPNVIIIWLINIFLIRKLYYQLFFISALMFLIKVSYLFLISRETNDFELILIFNLIWLLFSSLILLIYYFTKLYKKQ